ncbi:MAG TPA: hypothetical protein VL381_09825 [Rhodocyclaceae bacterium]|nr:hypothetical protein [Rhodocyclaceae bacterium]
MSSTLLFVDISSHGFGHLAQTAPILNALGAERDLRLMVRSGLPHAQLDRRIKVPFTHIQLASDFGFTMQDALSVDLDASAQRYRDAFANWSQRVEYEAEMLTSLNPDLVLSNVSPLPLAGAALAGIPSIAMCSLNWADLFAHFFADADWALPIHTAMQEAYASAFSFMALTPGMPMQNLPNRHPIGPIASIAESTRNEVADALRLPKHKRWLLVAFGGIAHRLPVESWPEMPGIQLIVPAEWQVKRSDCTSFSDAALPFAELLPHVDAVLTKPGYGTFTEAACNGIPVMYLRRSNWPESPYLEAWLHRHTKALALTPAMVNSGNIASSFHALLWQSAPALPQATGIAEAVSLINDQLDANVTIAA